MDNAVHVCDDALDRLLFEPFTTVGIYMNATYILKAMKKNPELTYLSAYSLFNKGSGMYFSEQSMRSHLPKIFRHFKNIKLLVKVRNKNEYVLNPYFKKLLEEYEQAKEKKK